MHLSWNCPFGNKTNLHLELPSFRYVSQASSLFFQTEKPEPDRGTGFWGTVFQEPALNHVVEIAQQGTEVAFPQRNRGNWKPQPLKPFPNCNQTEAAVKRPESPCKIEANRPSCRGPSSTNNDNIWISCLWNPSTVARVRLQPVLLS